MNMEILPMSVLTIDSIVLLMLILSIRTTIRSPSRALRRNGVASLEDTTNHYTMYAGSYY